MKKYILVSIVAIAIVSLAVSSYSLTGIFSKAFDKTLSPGELYEKNITIRKYYNLTVRLQKQGSTSYLTFDSNDTSVILKGDDGSVVAGASGLVNGKAYLLLEKSQLGSIRTISAYNLGDYRDVLDQPVNFTYSATTAYVTIRVSYKQSSITGYVIDELTGQMIEGIEVLAFPDSSDPVTTEPVAQNVSDTKGRYLLTLQIEANKALDVYVRNYDVS